MLVNKNKHFQSGIALVTTIILTSIMLSSIVVVTKEMVDEARNSIRINNSLIAYYAAEAGLEDALLEFRYDHDAEISQQNDADPNVDVTATINNTPRTVNLTTNITDYTTKSFGTSYYDLTMWNKVRCLVTAGDPNPFSCTTIPPLKADDTYEFSIDGIGANTIKLGFTPVNNVNPTNGYRVEITVLDENGNIVDTAKQFTCPANIGQPISYSNANLGGTTGKEIFRVKSWYTQYSGLGNCNTNPPPGAAGLNPDGTIQGAPVGQEYPYIHLNVNKNPNAQLISGPITNIESVGFYGGVQRKIVATLDRSSGNIIGIFDYVIYSASDLIK